MRRVRSPPRRPGSRAIPRLCPRAPRPCRERSGRRRGRFAGPSADSPPSESPRDGRAPLAAPPDSPRRRRGRAPARTPPRGGGACASADGSRSRPFRCRRSRRSPHLRTGARTPSPCGRCSCGPQPRCGPLRACGETRCRPESGGTPRGRWGRSRSTWPTWRAPASAATAFPNRARAARRGATRRPPASRDGSHARAARSPRCAARRSPPWCGWRETNGRRRRGAPARRRGSCRRFPLRAGVRVRGPGRPQGAPRMQMQRVRRRGRGWRWCIEGHERSGARLFPCTFSRYGSRSHCGILHQEARDVVLRGEVEQGSPQAVGPGRTVVTDTVDLVRPEWQGRPVAGTVARPSTPNVRGRLSRGVPRRPGEPTSCEAGAAVASPGTPPSPAANGIFSPVLVPTSSTALSRSTSIPVVRR